MEAKRKDNNQLYKRQKFLKFKLQKINPIEYPKEKQNEN